MSKANLKKYGVILGTVALGAVIFNSLANRVPAVNKARQVVRNGV